MKILKIRLRNINSLKGEWMIDLTDRRYDESGIFAITGPTGSGKTSILDALTLALYGRTPRIPSIGKTNEVMTRGAGDCLAEVTFRASGRLYKAFWAQRRARGKADGTLQNAEKRLERLDDDGQWREIAKMSQTAGRVEELTGMDFDRFTRSVLLAQGGFTAFLKAKPDDRAVTLEKLTGTEIYSEISKAVQRRSAAEQLSLRMLEDKRDAAHILSDEARLDLEKRLEEHRTEADRLGSTVAALTRARDWLSRLSQARLEEKTAADQADAAILTQTQAADKRERLSAAKRAAKLEADHHLLQNAKNEARRLAADKAGLEKKTPILAAQKAEAERLRSQASLAVDAALKNRTDAAPLIVEVRELDVKLVEAGRELAEAVKAEEEARRTDSLRRLSLSEAAAEAAGIRAALGKVTAVLRDITADAPLLEAREAVASSAESTLKAFAEAERRRKAAAAAKTHFDQAADKARLSEDMLAAKTAAAEAAAKALADAEAERDRVLEGEDASSLARRAGQSAERIVQIETLIRAEADLAAGEKHAAEAALQLEKNKTALEALSQESDAKIETLKAKRETCEAVRAEIAALETLALFKSERAALEDGKPCPLCGALHHPYAESLPGNKDEASMRLKAAEKAVAGLEADVSRLARDISSAKGHSDALEADIAGTRSVIAELKARAGSLRQALDIESGKASEALEAEKTARKSLADRINRYAEADKRITRCRRSFEVCEADVASAKTAAETAGLTRERTAEALKTAGEEFAAAEQAASEALAAFNETVSPFAASKASGKTDVARTAAALAERARVYEETLAEKERLAKAGELAGKDEENCRTLLSAAQKVSEEAGRRRTGKAAVRDALAEKRRTLYDDKDPYAEERRLVQAEQSARKSLDNADKTLAEADKACLLNAEKLKLLAERLSANAEECRTRESGWMLSLTREGFADETAWTAAYLKGSQIEALEKDLADIDKAVHSALERRKVKAEQRTAVEAEHLTDDTPEKVAEDLRLAREQLETVNRAIGADTEKRDSDDRQRSQKTKILSDIEKQKAVTLVWSRLSSLIGHNDGKTYRMFVQGLTFESLVVSANRALAKMTPRYTLKRDESEPLKLNVIDSYQANTERASDNLSGGESFIVSLALALGLSEMAGSRSRVDSLFLDEGFGTLDPEALESALGVLGSLNSEGKLIGIISHVGEIRDRIPVLIEVRPSGGISTVSGPGVSGS
ncbi:MAG: AAA family ATPase [Sutterella sp.]|nr:AAA family ATPase [Sutterella sp.]